VKRGGSSKRGRGNDDDPNDDDYMPNASDLEAESSVRGAGDDSEMYEDNGSDEDEILDLNGLNFPSRNWTAEKYSNARSRNQYNLARDTNVLFFHTQVQQDAFFGHMVKKTMFKHQTIDLGYMGSQPVMTDLVGKFENMGLSNFFQHRCDWNETVIRQFYATLEIDMVEETLVWMTGKRRYHATFAEFATANELTYNFLKDQHSINMMAEIHLMRMITLHYMSMIALVFLVCLVVRKVLDIIQRLSIKLLE
jgi:hypothetical protein